MVTPIAVSFAASLSPTGNPNGVRRCYYALFVVTALAYGVAVVLTHSVYGQGLFTVAGVAMTWTITALFAAVEASRGSGVGWVVLASSYALCVLTTARMPMLVIPFLLVLGPTGLRAKKRIEWAMLAILAFPVVFYTPLIQSYVFRHGQTGTIREMMTLDPGLVRSAGRLTMWPKYLEDIRDFTFGHGSTASVDFGNDETGGSWSHPHNDYIRILYDYGLIGVVLLAIPTIWVVRECRRGLRSKDAHVKYLYRVAFSGVLAMLLLGITGNTIMYSTWIGNPVFATLGVAFAERHRGLQAADLSKHSQGRLSRNKSHLRQFVRQG